MTSDAIRAVKRRQFLEGFVGSLVVVVGASQFIETPTGVTNSIIQPPPKLKTRQKENGFRFSEDDLWVDDPVQKSLVWRLVGAAEGCVDINGKVTPNYFGHTDPGNGVHNRGAFSYQFGNAENLTPQEADERQYQKLKAFYLKLIKPKITEDRLFDTEVYNAIDVVNQAPLCIGYCDSQCTVDGSGENFHYSEGNYFERLQEAKTKKLKGDDAILEARVRAFINPKTGKLDTTFVSEYWLRKDQKRRMTMMNQALEKWLAGVRPAFTPTAFNLLPTNPYVYQILPRSTHRVPLTDSTIQYLLWQQGWSDKTTGSPALMNDKVYVEGFSYKK